MPDRIPLPDRRHQPERRAPAGARSEPPAASGESQLDAARWRRAADLAPIGLALLSIEGQWIDVNRYVLELLGYSREEVLALHPPGFTLLDAIAPSEASRASLVTGALQQHRVKRRHVRRDGRVVWMRLTTSLARTPAGAPDYFVVAVEDVTARMRSAEALAARERSFLHIAATIPGVVYEFVRRRDGSSAFPCVGDAVHDLLGITAEELQRDPARFWELVHPDDRASLDAAIAHVDATLEPFHWEGRLILLSGAEKWIEANARGQRLPDGSSLWSGVAMDITERRRAAAQLEESEQRFRSLFELHPDAVFALDPAGLFTGLNPSSEHVTGYRPAELVGQPFALLIVPEHLDRALARFHAALRGEAQQPHELTIRHKSGQSVAVSVTTVPIVVGGKTVGVYGVARDLTAKHALDAKLRQAQKMEAIGRLAGGVAHDFNNLLMAILATSEILLEESAGRRCREDAQIIRETAERATVLIRQLLDFSRRQVVQPRAVDVNALVRNTGRMLRRSLGDRITVVLDLEPGLGTVLADRGQLEQAVVNLVVNARDAMPQGGRLTLRTRNVVVDEAAAREHQGLGAGTYVAIIVEDTGVGIAPDLQHRIFEPFVTTKPVGQGSGLGLATVFGLVEQWHGWIDVQSAVGKGAAFTMYLPQQPADPRAGDSAPREIGTRPNGTILVVDDEAAVRSSIRRMLTWKGYIVLEAPHGAEALRLLEQSPGRVDLILTDLVMPELDGRGLIAAVRRRPDAPAVVAMSGFDREAAMRGEPLPPDVPFLQKPFTSDQLFGTVREALAHE